MSLLFHIKDYVLQPPSVNFIALVSCFRFFLITELKKMSNISFLRGFQIILVKNDHQWKTFQMIYNMAIFARKKFFPTYQLWRHNILYLMRYLVFPAFWSHSVLLKIGQYTKRNLMIYSLGMLGKIIFVVTVIYDVISI